ncbi:MAG: hypothetical protein J3K34DRAFT_71897 [Monoraphidium minutum]|nr:MAG: hypothetical protein J3K34DRAFT_71897 [Monoraphidium minutum]
MRRAPASPPAAGTRRRRACRCRRPRRRRRRRHRRRRRRPCRRGCPMPIPRAEGTPGTRAAGRLSAPGCRIIDEPLPLPSMDAWEDECIVPGLFPPGAKLRSLAVALTQRSSRLAGEAAAVDYGIPSESVRVHTSSPSHKSWVRQSRRRQLGATWPPAVQSRRTQPLWWRRSCGGRGAGSTAPAGTRESPNRHLWRFPGGGRPPALLQAGHRVTAGRQRGAKHRFTGRDAGAQGASLQAGAKGVRWSASGWQDGGWVKRSTGDWGSGRPKNYRVEKRRVWLRCAGESGGKLPALAENSQ